MKTIVSMAGPDLMCVGSSDSSKNVLKVVDLSIKTNIYFSMFDNIYRD